MAFPYDEAKHQRGWHGRFSRGAGGSSNAHAMRMPVRAGPHPAKRLHAVSPVLHRGSAGLTINVGGVRPGHGD